MEARKHTDSFEAIFPSKKAISAFTVEEVLRHGRPKLDDSEDPGENPGYIFRGELGRVCKIARLPNTNLRLLLRFDRRGFGS